MDFSEFAKFSLIFDEKFSSRRVKIMWTGWNKIFYSNMQIIISVSSMMWHGWNEIYYFKHVSYESYFLINSRIIFPLIICGICKRYHVLISMHVSVCIYFETRDNISKLTVMEGLA